MLKISRPTFGLLTVINPELRGRVESELKAHGPKTPAIDGLSLLSSDPRISLDAFSPNNSGTGIYPDVGSEARASVFPLKDGWGLIATNDGAWRKDEYRWHDMHPHDDMNHLSRMLAHRLIGRGHHLSVDETVSKYLAHEEKRSAAGAKPPIRRFEQTA